jgi:hypothetical protein
MMEGFTLAPIREDKSNNLIQTTMDHDILQIAQRYLHDIGNGKAGQELESYFSKDVVQTEYPNRLTNNATVSDYRTLLQRSEQGRKIIIKQSYQIEREFVNGNTVILEVT